MDVSDKDIYSYIMSLAEDRDVVNMLSVNRKFSDDLYFKKILEKRYPLIVRSKLKNESYKLFYLRTIKYLAKLWEEFAIPYIPVIEFNPSDVYAISKLWKDGYAPNIYSFLLPYAIKVGDVKLVQHLIKKGAEIISSDFQDAAAGTLDMFKFLLSKISPPYYRLQLALNTAKVKNNRPIIDFLEAEGVKMI